MAIKFETLPFRHFAMHQIIEIPAFMIFWQIIFVAFAMLNNVLYEAMIGIPAVVNAFVRIAVIYISAGFVLIWGRYFVFEILHRDVPYATRRVVPTKMVIFSKNRFIVGTFIMCCGTILFYNRPFFQIGWLSIYDHVLLLLIWVVTDAFFFALHGAMHVPWLFKTFHYLHHQAVPRPNAFGKCEEFTPIDGLMHFVEYVIATSLINLVIPISNEIWLLGVLQWLIIGQLQHGGKAIWQNQIPGLEIVRRLAGVKHSFCLQHDLHHTKVNSCFSMTGIYDKWFASKKSYLFGANYTDDKVGEAPEDLLNVGS